MSSEPFLSEIALFSFDFAPRGWAQCNGQLLPINQNQALFSLLGTTFGGNGQTTFALPDLRGRVPLGAGQGPALEDYYLGRKEGVEHTALSVAQLPSHAHGLKNGLTFTERCRNSTANRQTPDGNVTGITSPPLYTDHTLTPGVTVVRATHFTELRTRIDAFRASRGLKPFSYTNPALTIASTVIQAQHVVDLRTALSQGYAAAMLPPPRFSEAIVVGVTPVKASHLTEIRNTVDAVTPVGTTYSGAPDADMRAGAIALSGAITALPAGSGETHENRQPSLALRYCIALQGIFPSAT